MFEIWRRKRANAKKLRDRGFSLRDRGFCYCCGGYAYVHSIHKTCSRTSRAGETFYHLSQELGRVCLRCSSVGRNNDCSGDEKSIDEWLESQEGA